MDRLIELHKWIQSKMNSTPTSGGYRCGYIDALRDVRIEIEHRLDDEGIDIAEKAGE